MDTQTVKILGGRSEVQFAPLGQTSGSAFLSVFDATNVEHLLTTIEEPINGWKTFTHTFRAKTRDWVDSFLQPFLSDNPLPLLSVRYGVNAGQEAIWRPWEDHVMIDHKLGITPDAQGGPLVTIRTADRLWLLHTIKKCRARKGLMSGIMADMWKEAGGDNSIIEPTTMVGHTNSTGIWYQAFESDWSFLMRTVLPLARNSDWLSGYRLYVRDNVLHFHTANYGTGAPKSLPFAIGTPGFDRLDVTDRFVEMAGGAGSSGIKRVVFDPVTGTNRVISSDPSKLLKFAGSRSSYVNWDYRASHVGPNLDSAEESRNQQHFSVLSSEVYQAVLTASKCMDLQVGDVIDVSLTQTVSESTPYGGLWLVNKVLHTLDKGAFSSKYILSRGEINTPTQRGIVGPDEYSKSSTAPGVDFSSSNASPAVVSSSQTVNNGTSVAVPIQPAG